jgi:hypothetical protein
MRKLVLTILKNESKGLKDFFEANVPLEKGLRSTSQGYPCPTHVAMHAHHSTIFQQQQNFFKAANVRILGFI